MKRYAVTLSGMLVWAGAAFAQPANVNPAPGNVWQFYGPSLGAGWGPFNYLQRDQMFGGTAFRAPEDYGAKCDVQTFSGSASWAAGGTAFTPNNGVSATGQDKGKKLIVYGAGAGGSTYVGTITGATAGVWTVSPALTQAPNLNYVNGLAIATPQSGAGSYVPGDTITAAGGTTIGGSNAVFTVKYTKVVSATVAAGGTTTVNDGSYTVTGTTGRGPYFSAVVTVAGGTVTSVSSISDGGGYFANPTDITNEPVTGGGLTGAALSLKMGVAQVLVTSPGGYSATAATLTQGSTSGSGTGATFTPTWDTSATVGHYGQWYYGTDDQAAFANASAWATLNRGTIRLPPKVKCGTSSSVSLSGNLASLEGDSRGYTQIYSYEPNSAIYWMGTADNTAAIVQIATPDGGNRVEGASVNRVALICANLAGYGVQFKTAADSDSGNIYTEQCTNAGIELTTNTNAGTSIAPTDTQRLTFHNLFLAQRGSNGVMLRLTGDTAVSHGDTGGVSFYRVDGTQGQDTGLEVGYASTNFLSNVSWSHTGSNALYSIDLGGVPLRYTYSMRIEKFNGGGTQKVIARGTQSSGDANVFSRQNIVLYGDDGQPSPIIEPSADLQFRTIYLDNNILRTNKILLGYDVQGDGWVNRAILDNTNSSLGIKNNQLFTTAATHALGYNIYTDSRTNQNYYVATGFGGRLLYDGAGCLNYKGVASGTGGTVATLGATSFNACTDHLQLQAPTIVGSSATTLVGSTSALGVAGDMSVLGATNFLGFNLYYASGYKYYANGVAFQVRAEDSSSTLKVGSAPSGTAGNAASLDTLATFTQGKGLAARITSATKTTNYPIVEGDAGTHFNNTGAGAEVDFTLPTAVDGRNYCFAVTAAQIVKIIASGSEKIAIAGSNSLAGGNITANAVYASVCIETHGGGQWFATATPDATQWTVN